MFYYCIICGLFYVGNSSLLPRFITIKFIISTPFIYIFIHYILTNPIPSSPISTILPKIYKQQKTSKNSQLKQVPYMSDPHKNQAHPSQQQRHNEFLDNIIIHRKRDQQKQFNKYQYAQKHLQPLQQHLINKYLSFHNQYHLNILKSKMICYEKYGSDPLLYYQCYDKVQNMVRTNFVKLYHQCYVINNKLDNCLSECTTQSKDNQEFQICTEGKNGCFQKYKRIVNKLYSNMYKVTLADPIELPPNKSNNDKGKGKEEKKGG